MVNLASSEAERIREWVDANCRHLDLVASWETLLGIYDTLRFIDPINDEIRMNEFRDIIQEINKFLTRMRRGLLGVSDYQGAIDFLALHVDTKDPSSIKTRSSLAYNKLRQGWVMQAGRYFMNEQAESSQDERKDEDE